MKIGKICEKHFELKRDKEMSTETSPFRWDGKTLKIKNMLDRYIALKPETKEIPVAVRDYEAILKTISPSIRHRHEENLMYHGRQILRSKGAA